MKKRILATLLCLCIGSTILFGNVTSVIASEANEKEATKTSANIWDGTVANGFEGGTGTAEDPYQIATGSQLAYLAEQINTQPKGIISDKNFSLVADIDLNNINWTPIGHAYAVLANHQYLTGIFNGNGHTISNLKISSDIEPAQYTAWGLFGWFSGTLTDLNLTGEMAFTDSTKYLQVNYVGGIAGMNGGVIKGCTVNMQISIKHKLIYSFIGGITGETTGGGAIENCQFGGNITADTLSGNIASTSVAGICGSLDRSTVDGCKNTATILARGKYVGGIVGIAHTGGYTGETVVSDCYNTGNISAYQGHASGIASYLSAVNNSDSDPASTKMYNCFSTGTVTAAGENPEKVKIAPICTETSTQAVNGAEVSSEMKNCYYTQLPVGAVTIEGAKKIDEELLNSADFLNSLSPDGEAKWVQASDGSVVLAWEIADYSKVDEALAKIPEDVSQYSDESVKALNDAKSQLVLNMLKTEQEKVDAMAKSIEDAIAGLILKGADYSKVDEAIAKIPSDLSLYTDETAQAVTQAKDAVVRDKNITEQTTVDSYASAIEDAIATLELKNADYSKVDSAIAKANALDKSNYKDFSKVNAAISAVVQGKKITEQSIVDGYATAIENAINELEKKSSSADSTKPSTPQTGDDSNIALWATLLLVSGSGVLAGFVMKRRKKTSVK